MSLQAFCLWLSATPVSSYLQVTAWIIPTVQTVHILCIAVVFSAVLLVHLNTLGLAMRGYSGAALAARLFPGLWWALVLLFVSGVILITAEPARSLPNGIFQLKMSLLLVAIALTLLYQLPMRTAPAHWEATTARRTNARAIAILSLVAWAGIVFAGRWIAYS